MNDIHTKHGLLTELKAINLRARAMLDKHYLQAGLSITQFRDMESQIFELWQREVFNVVHATTALENICVDPPKA